MNNNDSINLNKEELAELIKKLAPEFSNELDFNELVKYSNDPVVLAFVIFRLLKEREETNKIIANINDKFDKIMLTLKTKEHYHEKELSILSEQDEKILELARLRPISAKHIMETLGYKALNGACQRLNFLCRAGYLKKIRSGKNVLFTPINSVSQA